MSSNSPNASSVPPQLSSGAATARRRQATTRTKTHVACNACRSRRTKCDSQRPACSYCRTRGLTCEYQESTLVPLSRTDRELVGINHRLDYITSLLFRPPSQISQLPQTTNGAIPYQDEVNNEEKAPFQLLGRQATFTTSGLAPEFARRIRDLERAASATNRSTTLRLFMLQQDQMVSALAAFSAHVHVWYQIFRPGFSEHYFRSLGGDLLPSADSCMVLTVASIGFAVQDINSSGQDLTKRLDGPYFETAMASLPIVFTGSSIADVQSLALISIYYCCLCRPLQAHDYILIASLKLQNLLKSPDQTDAELQERVTRTYWAILLLESELAAQFDVAESGVWKLDDVVSLPDSRISWEYDIEAESPAAISTSPASVLSTVSLSTNKVQSYFLAEIAMRRMLHRCNTAVRRTPVGAVVYASNIALELELQLEEWYSYLPDIIRFEIDMDSAMLSRPAPSACALSNFLRVQYHCCKISIYWPAVYQAMQDGVANEELLGHCRRFFNSYLQLTPSILAAFHECSVNRWTLFATMFITTLAVAKAAATPCLSSAVDMPTLKECILGFDSIDRRMVEVSPSMTLLVSTLRQELRMRLVDNTGDRG